MEKPLIQLTFFGGAETVTGSKTLLKVGEKNILIDCGLFQGLKELRIQNRAPFPIPPEEIDEVILTHAHLDHCGYLPLLVKNGFSGPIHCTAPTRELSQIILLDSAKIQEEDAERAKSHDYSKHKDPEPLYKIEDVVRAMDQFVVHDLHEWVLMGSEIKFQFLNNGHILGSAFVELIACNKKIIFSGDIGRSKPMLLYPPKKITNADYIVMESTYGDRRHTMENVKSEILRIIDETLNRKGILMIPTFAVERTQELIFLLHELREEQKLPHIPIYLDSPMGINSTNVYKTYKEWQNLSRYNLEHMYNGIIFINDYEHSRATVADKKPKIVLAGSGMMEGGRILHYLFNHIENSRNTLLFVGYQGDGTRGRAIIEGSQEIKIFGEYKTVNCKIESLSSLSAHADQQEILDWLKHFDEAPSSIFLNHGEPHQTDALRARIEHELKWKVILPKMHTKYNLH